MAGREWIAVYLKGFAMGAADAVPGVSGGTIALITGIYERLVDAIAELDPREALALLPALVTIYDPESRALVHSELVRMDVPFLAVLAFGLLTAVISVANVIEHAIEAYPAPTFAFFFGLIVASIVLLADEADLQTLRGVTIAVVGFVLAFVVSGPFQQALPSSLLVLFLVGGVAICAMVLPGVSGSLILLTLGQYHVMTGAVSKLTSASIDLANGGELAALVDPLRTLVVFALGAVVGILTFARVVSWAFETYRRDTLTFLVALMAGALRAPGREVRIAVEAWTMHVALVVVGAAAVGAAAVLLLDHYTDDLDY